MILLVADELDTQARWLAEQWEHHDARLLTPADLSRPGWTFRPGSSPEWTGVAGVVGLDHHTPLAGILNCLAEVSEAQLPHIHPEERSYVANEMTAFLLSWQCELTCPVLNRPTPNCLIGLNLSDEGWTQMAAGLGLPVRTTARTSHGQSRTKSGDAYRDTRSVTVIGECALGEDSELQFCARSLAQTARVDLATFYFTRGSDPEFIGASLRPDLSHPQAVEALLHCFQRPRPC
jgi:hypothetical protein